MIVMIQCRHFVVYISSTLQKLLDFILSFVFTLNSRNFVFSVLRTSEITIFLTSRHNLYRRINMNVKKHRVGTTKLNEKRPLIQVCLFRPLCFAHKFGFNFIRIGYLFHNINVICRFLLL